MKKTQFIELKETIKRTIVSFISITIFVTLSIGVFVGISWSANAILESAQKSLNDSKSRDIEILFPYGLEKEDIDTLSKIEGIDEIQGVYTGYSFFKHNGRNYQAKLYQLNDVIDCPFDIEGDLPSKYNEIGIDKEFAKKNTINIGDTIQFISDVENDEARALVKIMDFDIDEDDFTNLENKSDNSMAYLKTDSFVVTSILSSNDYLNSNPNTYGVALTNQLAIDCFVYLPEEAFDETSFAGYPDIIIRSEELNKYSTYSDEYKQKTDELVEKIRNSVDLATGSKNQDIKNKINNIINNAQTKLDNAQTEIQNSEKQIYEGRKLLANGKVELEEGKIKLEDGESEYNSSKQQIDSINGTFDSYYGQYVDFKQKILSHIINEEYINEHKDEISNVLNKLLEYIDKYDKDGDLNDVASLLKDILDNLDTPEVVLEKIYNLVEHFDLIDRFLQKIKDILRSLYNDLANGRSQLDEYWDQYYAAENEYYTKKSQLATAEKKVAEAKGQYEEAVNKLAQFIEQTSQIKEYGYTIMTRSYNVGLLVCKTLSDMFYKLRYTMAALFVCVGLLVCYSAISRIINDEIRNIGTKKALGLTEKEVLTSYLSYTGISLIIGCLLGIVCGCVVVEKVLLQSINNNIMCKLSIYFSLKDALIICGAEFVILMFVTYIACRSILKKNAIQLLAGQEIAEGKQRFFEKTKLWNKLPLITKTIVNNCFNEKRRVFATIVGIVGATSLIVTALTLNNNILDSFEIQYSKYHHFDTIISFDENNTESKQKMEQIFNDNNIPYAQIMYSRMFTQTPDNTYVSSILFVPENYDEFNKLMFIESIDERQYDNKGFWITSSYYEYYKPNRNDTISLRNIAGSYVDIVPDGYFTNYLTNYHIVMDRNTYEDNFNDDVKFNAYIISTFNTNYDSLMQQLEDTSGFISNQSYYLYTKGSFEAFETLSKTLVIVYIVLSVVMAFLVILNLLVMFVNEKKRELIVLMINGYYLEDAKRYIYSDTIFLTIIGIILGCIVGSIMGNAAVSSFESNTTLFLHRIDIKACLIGAAGTSLLTFIVCLIALRKISKFQLTDINKQ